MPFDIILASIAGAALIAVVVMVVRKFPALARLNPESVKDRQEASLKDALIEERLRRKASAAFSALAQRTKPFLLRVRDRITSLYRRLVEMEKDYRTRNLQRQEKSMSALQHVNRLLAEAHELFDKEEYAEAEQKCIEAVGLDPKKEETYELLGEIYMAQKDFTSAKQSFEHLVKLKEQALEAGEEQESGIALAYLDLCLSLKELGSLPEAQDACSRAVKADPNNPRNLSALLDVAVLRHDKPTAWSALDSLKKANPENQKLAELEETVKAL